MTNDADAYYAMDAALGRWENIRDLRDALRPENRSLPSCLREVFGDWDILVHLEGHDEFDLDFDFRDHFAGLVLAKDGLLLGLPYSTPDGDDGDAAFDEALSVSISSREPIELIEGFVKDWQERQQFTAGYQPPSARICLVIEAVVLAAPVADRDSIRMMLALHGIEQPLVYQRVV